MYITGSTKGRLQFWKFNSGSNAAVNEYVTDRNLKDNASDQWNIAKIKLNGYGDKMAVSDQDGNLYMFNLSSGQEDSEPGVVLKKATYYEFLDFDFLNQGTVLCATGFKPTPHLTIVDLLMPPSKRAVVQEAIGGNIVLGLHDTRQVLLFNSKQRGMNVYDLRTRKFFDQFVGSSLL